MGEKRGKAGSPALILPLRHRQMLLEKSTLFLPLHKEKRVMTSRWRNRGKGKRRKRKVGKGRERSKEEVCTGVSILCTYFPFVSSTPDFCSVLMAGASDLFPSIATDVFQLYL